MYCEECHEKNIKKANYCKKCGRKFTEAEKKVASMKSIFYYINEIEDWYNTITLSKITGSWPFKIGALLLVVIIGTLNYVNTGMGFSIKENESYKLEYNDKNDEYYVTLTDNGSELDYGKVFLSLNVPNAVNNITIKKYDSNSLELENKEYKKDEEIILNANTVDNEYYVISDNIEKDKDIKVYVYLD